MAKKTAAPKQEPQRALRLDPAEHGIDLQATLAEIRKHLVGTQTQIAEAAGIRQPYVAEIFTGRKQPSLAALAALAAASGGRLELTYKPPRKRAATGASKEKR